VVQRLNRPGAETAALSSPVQGQRPRRSQQKPGGVDVWLGTMSGGDVARRLCGSPMAVFYRRRKLGMPRFVNNS
jgi:hypothetical protein